ncbi:carbon starvation protein CstA [Melioribacter roseus P3M-2]|uniref:Carbon starvation protein CstA n=1 Tax=Melioribacter roseus (strain DSM 23840 / JCM 17771 / VKM B-2668 / P3M-2) TaxID=1191523 RepID=I6YY40_MELRP|nr:carbon starvation protein A [Melioribacter roseus]AFN75452.1 carbon starvation protein CstA [Melioribacter roseus P3M-2]
MSGIILVVFAIILFISAYRIYGNFISNKFSIDGNHTTPSHEMYDGVDYVPAKPPVLLGHHFASIAGAGPIVGPIIAASFGWAPVYAWILIGSTFIGGVHDYTALIASIRHKGKTIGQVIENYIGLNGKKLFLIFTWSTLILVIAVFTIIVSNTFNSIPSAGTASILFIVIAIAFGLLSYRKKIPLLISSAVGIVLLALAIYFGNQFPLLLSKQAWIVILLVYIFFASVTPVWILLQPRDYLNSFLLYALMLGGIAGLFFTMPEVHLAPVTNFNINKIGYLFPALFVTVACGAISGFHSIVSSGTTAKQLDKETDAKLIGYGGMLIEGVLAVLALLSVASLDQAHFIQLLNEKGAVTAFSTGIATFINNIPLLGIDKSHASSFAALAVAAFALTSLDTATRLARYTFQEFFETRQQTEKSGITSNRYFATFITVIAGGLLTMSGQSMTIWPVFGSANQLLAAIALLAITVWVINLKINYYFTLIPMLFMFAVTLSALAMLFYNNFLINNYLLSIVSIFLFVLAVMLAWQAFTVLRTNTEPSTSK